MKAKKKEKSLDRFAEVWLTVIAFIVMVAVVVIGMILLIKYTIFTLIVTGILAITFITMWADDRINL